ncbi:MAG: SurA N-terminal domain-containing protein [Gammaproteobacteria bacterium]
MLQSIRDHTHGWIAGTIISLLILSFALWGIHSYTGAGASNTVANVNGAEITKNQLSIAFERLRRQLQMQSSNGNELPSQEEAGLKDKALQTLIGLEVLKQASINDDYRITSDQIDNFLQGMPEFQVNGEFSIARFNQALSTTLFTAGDFLDLIKTSLLIDQPRMGIVFTSYALPNEISNTIALIGQERDIQYLVIPPNYAFNTASMISDENINAYYNKHQDEFKTAEQASLDYIELTVNEVADKIHPTEDALKTFYNENSSAFAQPAAWKLEAIIVPLTAAATAQDIKQAQTKMNEIAAAANKGTDFSKLIKQYSVNKGDDKLNHWSTLNQLPVELQKEVSTLTASGKISAPIVTNNGIVLIKTIAYKEPQAQPLELIKEKVKTALARQQAEEQFNDKREKLANLTYEHPDSLSDAAKELGLSVKTTGVFTKEKGAKDITASTKVREAAFSNEVLNLQNNSDVIQTTPDSVIVIRIKTHESAALLPLNTVKQQISDKLKTIAIENKLHELSNEIQNKLQTGALTPEEVSAQYKLQWSKVGYIGRHTTKVDQAILDAAFEMQKPEGSKSITYAAAKITNGFAVIGLIAIKDSAIDVKKEEYQAFAEQIQTTEGVLEYDLYKQSLMQRAKIKIES